MARADAAVGRPALRRPGGADDDKAPPRRSGGTTDLPACDPVVGVFPETLGGETGDAELSDVKAPAAGAGRVYDTGTVRSWPGLALVGSRRVGARNPTVGRAIE